MPQEHVYKKQKNNTQFLSEWVFKQTSYKRRDDQIFGSYYYYY